MGIILQGICRSHPGAGLYIEGGVEGLQCHGTLFIIADDNVGYPIRPVGRPLRRCLIRCIEVVLPTAVGFAAVSEQILFRSREAKEQGILAGGCLGPTDIDIVDLIVSATAVATAGSIIQGIKTQALQGFSLKGLRYREDHSMPRIVIESSVLIDHVLLGILGVVIQKQVDPRITGIAIAYANFCPNLYKIALL